MYLTSSKLAIYPFKNDVYISNFGKATLNDVTQHRIDAAHWLRASVDMGIEELKMSVAYLIYSFHTIKQHNHQQ